MRKGREVLVLAGLVVGCSGPLTSGPAPKLPLGPPSGVGIFSRSPQYLGAKLSPRGTYLGVLADENGETVLRFEEVATGHVTHVLHPPPGAMVDEFWWVNDERIVATLVSHDRALAEPVSYGELYAVDATGAAGFLVYGYRAGDRASTGHPGGRQNGSAYVVDTLHDERSALIAVKLWGERDPPRVRLYRLDTYSGERTPLAISPLPYARFVTDETGFARIAVGAASPTTAVSFYREQPSGAWRELDVAKGVTPHSQILGFVARDRLLYVSDDTADGGLGVFAVDFDTGERRLLWRSDATEPSAIVTDNETGRIVAVESQPDRPVYDFLAPDHPKSRLLRGMLAAFPGEHVVIESTSRDVAKAVVLVYSDRDPGRSFLVDVASLSTRYLMAARSWIEPDTMAERRPFEVRARDGQRLRGYLTLPRSHQDGTPVALVVLPHGGPVGMRDRWEFDPEAQLLAHAGYAVLQVNYRGSSGYGVDFAEAGFRQWGGRVQDDLIDATRELVRQGIADAERICIYGSSFGGYSAMQSAIRAPELFRCAVGYSGLYDLELHRKIGDTRQTRYGRDYLQLVLGDDPAELAAGSPVRNAAKLRARVMLIHGAKDERCPLAHAVALKRALEREGRTVEWLVESHEGHGFVDEVTRERMYTRLLTFLRASLREPEHPPAAAAASTRP